MPNLETNNQTDKDLTVVKSNDVYTSLSLSEEGNGAKVDGDLIITKDLHVQVNIKGISDSNYPVSADTVTANNLESLSGGDLTLKSTSGDLVVDVGGLDLKLGASGTSYIEMNVINGLKIYDISDTPNDYAQFKTETHGQLKIITEDASGNNLGDLVCDIEGAIVLDSNNGEFNMRNAGVNFSPTNAAYAGMILGYTNLCGSYTTYTMTTTMTVVDSNAKVSFKAPPSGNVEIDVHVYRDSSTSVERIYLGLSDNATYNQATGQIGDGSTSIDQVYSHGVDYADETDDRIINCKFVVCGLTPNTDYEYWLGASATTGTTYLRWGGTTGTDPDRFYPPLIMKATALPKDAQIQND